MVNIHIYLFFEIQKADGICLIGSNNRVLRRSVPWLLAAVRFCVFVNKQSIIIACAWSAP